MIIYNNIKIIITMVTSSIHGDGVTMGPLACCYAYVTSICCRRIQCLEKGERERESEKDKKKERARENDIVTERERE